MDENRRLIYALLLLVLVGSALLTRRIPISQMLKMFLMWIGIFLSLFVIFSFRSEFINLWEHIKSDIAGTSNQSNNGEKIILNRRDDGHFWIKIMVNDVPIDFLIDSGATGISMSSNDADQAGIDYDLDGFAVIMSTANGLAKSYRARANKFQTEHVTYNDVAIFVSPTLGDVNLLGMSYLNRLESWQVRGSQMILQP